MSVNSRPEFDLQHVQKLQMQAELAAGAGFWSIDLATGHEYCSPALSALLEREPKDTADGVPAWRRALQPADAAVAGIGLREAIAAHAPFHASYAVTLPRAGLRRIEVHGRASYDAAGQPLAVSGYCIDVTDRWNADEEFRDIKERQSFLLRLSDALAPLSDPVQIQVEACRVLGEYLRVNRVFYAEADETGLNRAGPQYVVGVPPTSEVWHSSDYDPDLVRRYQTGEVQSCDDVSGIAGLTEAQRKAYSDDQIVAWAAAPISKRGLPIGRLVIHQNKPRRWKQFEIDLIKETAERVWPAVQRAKSQAALELTENIPVGTYTMVLAPHAAVASYSFLSKRFLEITGLDAEDVRGDALKAFACIHPDDRQAWIASTTEAWARRAPLLAEARLIVRGETRWVRAESTTRHLPDGATVWEGVLIDITAQRRAEDALQQSEERYRLIADITQEAWWEEDVKAHQLTNSPRFREILACGEGILRCSVAEYRDLIHPDDRGYTRSAYERTVNDDADYREVYRLRHADGHYVWVEDHARVIERDAEGRATRLLGAITDITARRTTEIALQRSEENFRRLFDDAPDAYVIMDLPGFSVLACNHAAARMLRGSREQLQGMTPEMLSPPLQPNGTTTKDAVQKVVSGIKEKGNLRFEWMHRRLDGEDFWVEVSAATGTLGGQQVLFVSWREIGEILAAKQAAEAANVAKSQFLSVMSHELRTPLTAILGMFQLIQMTSAGTKAHEFAMKGQKSADHLLDLVNDVLDFSSIESGRIVTASKPFQLGTLLDEVVQIASARRKPAVQFVVKADEAQTSLALVGDALRLKQVLINLAGNALKFTERGSVVLSVTRVGGSAEAPLLEFAVADTGIGMSSEQKGRLFQPFTQVDMSNERRFGGTGLGLVISQRLVNLMGGTPILVETETGSGSRFAFQLALPVAASGMARREEPQARPQTAAAARLAGRRILIVEDSEITRMALRLMLESEGARIDEAVDGVEGVNAALAAGLPYDIVLMDMQMPRKDGLEATRELRARGYAQPIVALTANAFSSDLEACLAAGMDRCLTKPVRIADLVDALQKSCA